MESRKLLGVVLGFLIATAVNAPVIAAGPGIGDQAPTFDLIGSDGKTYSLAQYRGEQVVVLAWFPKAFTGG